MISSFRGMSSAEWARQGSGGEVREEQNPRPFLPLLKHSLERDAYEALILGQNHLRFVYNVNQS